MSVSSERSLLSRQDSVGIQATLSAATAFGEDLADDSYSISELSHYNQEKKRKKFAKLNNETFVRTTLLNLDRQESAAEQAENCENEDIKRNLSSANSVDQSETGSAESEESDISLTATTFTSFAQSRFVMKVSHSYSCACLPHPLLPKSDRADYLAAMACWLNILRVMGDMPDPDSIEKLVVAGANVSMTSKLKGFFKTKYTKKDVDDAHKKYTELFKDPLGTDSKGIPFLSSSHETMLEKVQMLCAVGIYKPSLRDELYCQLCKQLTNNPSRNSIVRGWVLMSMFAGSFTPSENFAPSLTSFLIDGPAEFSEKADWLLRRTCSVGTRGHPPSWLEFQAAKNGKPLLLPVMFMSGHKMLCEVDAAMTISEVIRHISERLGLSELTGFSLYISLHTKISCLGHGQHRIMDAISESDQYSKQMGIRESNAIWRLFFRLEFFSSWHTPEEDPVSTDLIYQQIKRGITMSEYRLENVSYLISSI